MRAPTRVALAAVLVVSAISAVAVTASRAQATAQEVFFSNLLSSAKKSKQDFGVPISVSLAQAALESGWGKSTLSAKHNSFFGIKCFNNGGNIANGCVSLKTKEYRDDGSSYTISASFRTYASAADSFRDHGNFLRVNSRYAAAFRNTSNPDQFVREVHKAGYATDPAYADTVIRLMRQYNLYSYDAAASSGSSGSSAPAASKLPPTLRQGRTAPAVRTLQYLLTSRGFKVPTTAYFGTLTNARVREFQKANRLAVDGIVGKNTWGALLPSLSQGKRGDAVRALQLELNQSGAKLIVDGIFGSRTKAALVGFQKSVGLSASGVANSSTWAALLNS